MTESERVQAEALRSVESKQRVSRLWRANDPLVRYLEALDYATERRGDKESTPDAPTISGARRSVRRPRN